MKKGTRLPHLPPEMGVAVIILGLHNLMTTAYLNSLPSARAKIRARSGGSKQKFRCDPRCRCLLLTTMRIIVVSSKQRHPWLQVSASKQVSSTWWESSNTLLIVAFLLSLQACFVVLFRRRRRQNKATKQGRNRLQTWRSWRGTIAKKKAPWWLQVGGETLEFHPYYLQP